MVTYPVYISPDGKEYQCILWANSLVNGWEWYGFELAETNDTDIELYFGYVEGFESEFGYFTRAELIENKVYICTDPDALHTLQPPVGWTKKP